MRNRLILTMAVRAASSTTMWRSTTASAVRSPTTTSAAPSVAAAWSRVGAAGRGIGTAGCTGRRVRAARCGIGARRRRVGTARRWRSVGTGWRRRVGPRRRRIAAIIGLRVSLRWRVRATTAPIGGVARTSPRRPVLTIGARRRVGVVGRTVGAAEALRGATAIRRVALSGPHARVIGSARIGSVIWNVVLQARIVTGCGGRTVPRGIIMRSGRSRIIRDAVLQAHIVSGRGWWPVRREIIARGGRSRIVRDGVLHAHVVSSRGWRTIPRKIILPGGCSCVVQRMIRG